MPEYVDLAKANRQMVAERQALLAERDRFANILKQRSVNVAIELIEGLGVLTEQAATGNPAAKQALGQLLERLEAARALQTGLVIANGRLA